MLCAEGKPAPAEDVPEHKRHLRYRDALIKHTAAAGNVPAVPATAAVLADALVCPTCHSYVADQALHDAAAHSA